MRTAKALAPANVSCIFRIYGKGKKRGSLGVGFTLDKGATAEVRKSNKTGIILNGKMPEFSTVKRVIERLSKEKVEVRIKSSFPFGCGFGMSGASALATAYALNKLFNLNKTDEELAMIAHESEVENSTGLGDVAGQFNGGFMIRTTKGKPLHVGQLPVKEKTVYYKVFGEIDTKKVIDSEAKKKRINRAGDRALSRIKRARKIDFAKVIEISKQFSIESGLLKSKRLIKAISEIERKGGKGSMIMLGEAVFSNVPFAGCKKAKIIQRGARAI
jgi:pantoate kinase